jgi:catechol 2,3-dioxygenase-like lactoylglutathione lyase family enzyme
MLGFMILTVSNVERSLAFYEAALKPLNIKFFLPYKGEGGHPDLWGFGDGKQAFFWLQQGKPDPAPFTGASWPKAMARSMNSTRPQSPLAPGTIFRHAHVEYYPGYYAADVFDPDGYSFEVVHKS